MTTKKDDVLIKVEGLHKIYGDFHALNGIDEEIHRGEVVVIVGPSGSGKSTFLRSLNLLEVPDQGHIYFEGVDITDKHVDINKHRQKMGMVFQQFNLFNNLSVLENLTISQEKVKGVSPDAAKEKAMELLSRVGLADKAEAYPAQLSGGQKQRVSIARIFLKNPPILILDEGTSAIDSKTAEDIEGALLAMEGLTLITITHHSTLLSRYDRVFEMAEGKLALANPAAQ